MKEDIRQENNPEVGRKSVLTYTVDSYQNGIAFGQHRHDDQSDPRTFYSLRIKDEGELVRLRSRYTLEQENPLHAMERHLMRLSTQGRLRKSVIYFGVTTDPFLPFEGKFDATMKFLDLFRRYTPGLLVVQTRSPLIVLAMPVLQKLGNNAAVTIGIETPSQEVANRYTPGLPRVEERLKAALALKRFGIEVTLQVTPLLPYGDWRRDANKFARLLTSHSDFVTVQPIHDGSERGEKKIRALEVARKLADDREFFYLRPDSALPLVKAIEAIRPEALKRPTRKHLQSKQMNMFAA